MVKTTRLYHRFAFSLIEIVFTIVVVGIIVMSLPSMTSVTSHGVANNLAQEAIFATSAELNQDLSYYWDKNSLDVSGTSSISSVINLNNECDTTTKLRPGHINQPKHRKCLNDTTITTPADISDETVPNLNNAVVTDKATFTDDGSTFSTSVDGYKTTLSTSVSVSYASFGAASVDKKNIKKITVTISDNDSGETITQLVSYSANIGEIDFNRRTY